MAKTKYYAFADINSSGGYVSIRFLDDERCYDTKEEAVKQAKEYLDCFCQFDDEDAELVILEVNPVCRVGYVKHFEEKEF